MHYDSSIVDNDILLNCNEPLYLMNFIELSAHSYILLFTIFLSNNMHQLNFCIICHYDDISSIFIKMLCTPSNDLNGLERLIYLYWDVMLISCFMKMKCFLRHHYIVLNNLEVYQLRDRDMIDIMQLINYLKNKPMIFRVKQ